MTYEIIVEPVAPEYPNQELNVRVIIFDVEDGVRSVDDIFEIVTIYTADCKRESRIVGRLIHTSYFTEDLVFTGDQVFGRLRAFNSKLALMMKNATSVAHSKMLVEHELYEV